MQFICIAYIVCNAEFAENWIPGIANRGICRETELNQIFS